MDKPRIQTKKIRLRGNANDPAMPVFIPHLFKTNSSKRTLITALDRYITDDASKEYCSLMGPVSESGKKMPRYFQHYEKFTDNVLDISPSVFDDIAKMHIEREAQFIEEEKKEDEHAIQQQQMEMKMKENLDRHISSILNKGDHYIKRSCPVKIPFKSTLNHDQHEFYLRAFIKYQMRPPANRLEEKEYEQYMSMQNDVFHEQSCLMNFSFKVAQLTLQQYNSVPLAIDNYISSYVAHRSRRALSYPQHYKNEMDIPLKPQQQSISIPDHFQLIHLGQLLSLGWIPFLKMPYTRGETKFPLNESVAAKKPPDRADDEFDRRKVLFNCPVSEDPNAEYLAKKHDVSVVMSPSAFKTIVDNQEQTFEKEWNIPVRVKTVKRQDKNGKETESRIIFIDKPFPRKTWLPMQKRVTFLKASAKIVLTPFPNPTYRCEPPFNPRKSYTDALSDLSDGESSFPLHYSQQSNRKKKKKRPLSPTVDITKDLFLSEDDGDHSTESPSPTPSLSSSLPPRSPSLSSLPPPTPPPSLSSFPPPSASSSMSSLPPPPPPTHSDCGEKEGGNVGTLSAPSPQAAAKGEEAKGLLDSLLNKQDSFLKLKPKFTLGSSQEDVSYPPPLTDREGEPQNKGSLLSFWPKKLSTEWGDHRIKRLPFRAGTNYHYQLFSFERTEQSPVKEERVEPLRILIRHSIHGIQSNKKKQEFKPTIIFPKLENQIYFGCEVNSLSEIAQQWADLVLRPNTTLLQVRICVESGSLMMIEEKNLETVLKESKQNHLNFNPQTAFSTLNVIFNTVKKMSSGDYMLHHSAKSEAFIILLKSFNSEVSRYPSRLDLHNLYSDGTINSRHYKNAPWLAIDTHVITPFHKFHRKIPGTFPMQNISKLHKNEKKKRKDRASKKMVIAGYK